jgi:hypothetical protein
MRLIQLVVLSFAAACLVAFVLALAAGTILPNGFTPWIGVVAVAHMTLITALSLRRPARLYAATSARTWTARAAVLAAGVNVCFQLARVAAIPKPVARPVGEQLVWSGLASLLVLSSLILLVGFSIGLRALLPRAAEQQLLPSSFEAREMVFVRLIGEGTQVFRPVPAVRLDQRTFRLAAPANHDLEDEEWEFESGTVVRCERRMIEGRDVFVAISRVD